MRGVESEKDLMPSVSHRPLMRAIRTAQQTDIGLYPSDGFPYPHPVRTTREYRSASRAVKALATTARTVLFYGDCMNLIRKLPDEFVSLTISSPPYCLGKAYEASRTVEKFIADQQRVLPEIARITKPGGSICWQVGYHTSNNETYPLDLPVFSILSAIPGIAFRNRVIWAFGHGLHQTRRFSGRHETLMWFTKGSDYFFDLGAVRTPQKYPGKRRYKGPRKGEFSGNPKGKNPGDVWEIPNVKGSHIEKLDHPCQFPVGLADRLVRALCPKGGLVFDPYMGSASTGVAAAVNGVRFLGAEVSADYQAVAYERLLSAHQGTVAFRSADQPIYVAGPGEAVARRPEHFFGGVQ